MTEEKFPLFENETPMAYLNFDRLNVIDPAIFQAQKPYPWINPQELITPDGYQQLLTSLPDVSLLEGRFGEKRAHGQQSHDRYTLEYHDGLPLAKPWKEFMEELHGKRYHDFLKGLLGVSSLELNFHWHYTPNGCSVSPHCDAKHKLGSHIFYFNTEADWDPAWGGETVVLETNKQLNRKSAPKFEDFDRAISSKALGNYSFLFARKEPSWHGVREIQCPPDRMRKVFIVVINRFTPLDRLGRLLGAAPKGY